MNFYCWFIAEYLKITAPLIDLLKESKESKKLDLFKFLSKAEEAFKKLKYIFTSISMLRYYNPIKPTRLKTNALGFTLVEVIT